MLGKKVPLVLAGQEMRAGNEGWNVIPHCPTAKLRLDEKGRLHCSQTEESNGS